MIEIHRPVESKLVRFRKLYKLPCGSHVFLDQIRLINVVDRSGTEYKSLVSVEMEDDSPTMSPRVFITEFDTIEAAQAKADEIAAAVNEYWRPPSLMKEPPAEGMTPPPGMAFFGGKRS